MINLSEEGQPIADDDDNLISELSNFLGTTVREFVSLTCRSWHEVPEKDILWEYVKVTHFKIKLSLIIEILDNLFFLN